MVEQDAEQSQQTLSAKTASRFRWLIAPQRRGLLLPVSGLWILALDWLLFSSNAASLGLATPIIIAVGFLFGTAGTFFFQSRFAGDKLWKSTLKALVAGIVVGVPWPVVGTLVGGWVIIVSGLSKAKRADA